MKKLIYFVVAVILISMNGQFICFAQDSQKPQESIPSKKASNTKNSDRLIEHKDVKNESRDGMQQKEEEKDMTWCIRLAPHGDAKIAANAIVNYVKNYQKQTSVYTPNWTCLGPNGTPVPSQCSSYLGLGQITRITFDPNYNGTSNKIVYAASTYGGLWRSEDSGENWTLLNTDLLPVTNVADIAVGNNNLFITLGLCDGRFPEGWGSNWGYINPLFTGGIWRSTNYGQSWESITNNFFLDFANGGTASRIICDPTDQNKIYMATSWGVYRSTNALTANPLNVTWTRVYPYSGNSPEIFRGVEFKPGDPNTIYASGNDIYKSTNGGTTWASMTSSLADLNLPTGYTIETINITVNQADANRLYAFIMGHTQTGTTQIFIFVYENGWVNKNQQYGSFSGAWMGLAAYHNSLQNLDELFFGGVQLHGSLNLNNYISFGEKPGFHDDIHCLAFEPNVTNPKLFCGDDGGVSVLSINTTTLSSSTFAFKNNGIENSLIWAFDESEINKDQIITAHQDNGVMTSYRETSGLTWYSIISGQDGYSARIDDLNPNLEFCKGNSDSYLYRTHYDDKCFIEVEGMPEECSSVESWMPTTFPMVNDPQTGVKYFGFSELYKRKMDEPSWNQPWSDVWEQESDLFKTEPYNGARRISEIAIAESNNNYIYLIGAGQTIPGSPPFELHSKIYLSTDGGIHGDCSALGTKFNLINFPDNFQNTTNIPIITGIAVDPLNERRFWISFSGYIPGYKVWNYDPDNNPGDHWLNADPNGIIDNLPVNGIVYQAGTNDRLYIATDAGVYVRNGNQGTDWEKYGDCPNVRSVEIKINYCLNKLRVATFGRGVWEGDLLPPTQTFETTVSSNTTWSFLRNMHGDLRINNGATLTVQDIVNMPPDSKVIVEPGAKLVIDGGTFTNACGSWWQGIEVWGHANLSQTYLNQGSVSVNNNGKIVNARIGILSGKRSGSGYDDNYSGGLVHTDHGILMNNGIAVYMRPYTQFSSNPTFTATNFSTTPDVIDINQFESFIKVSDINSVIATGCSFINSFSTDPTGTGIYASGAGINVSAWCSVTNIAPCPIQDLVHCTFINLTTGIYAINTSGSHSVTISRADFSAVQKGIYLSAFSSPTLVLNTFNIPEPAGGVQSYPGPYGMYLDYCNLYHVEGNTFQSTATVPTTIGLVVNNSGPYANVIYRNTFLDLKYNTVAQDVNRVSSTTAGLCYVCNSFKTPLATPTYNTAAIVVTHTGSYSSTYGIARYQNAVFGGNIVPTFNRFYNGNSPPPTPQYYDIFDNCYQIDSYLYPTNFNLFNGYTFYPIRRSSNVTPTPSSISYSNQCPDMIDYGGTQSKDGPNTIGNSQEGWNMKIIDSLASILKSRSTLDSYFDLALFYLQYKEIESAQAIIQELPGRFILTQEDLDAYQSFIQLFNIIKDRRTSSVYPLHLTDNQTIELAKINDKRHDRLGSYARNMLIEARKINYVEPIILPVFEGTAMNDDQYGNGIQIINGYLRVHPNPANNYVIVDYDLSSKSYSKAGIKVFSSLGKLLVDELLTMSKTQITINTEKWSSGIYFLTLELDGNVAETYKINITK